MYIDSILIGVLLSMVILLLIINISRSKSKQDIVIVRKQAMSPVLYTVLGQQGPATYSGSGGYSGGTR